MARQSKIVIPIDNSIRQKTNANVQCWTLIVGKYKDVIFVKRYAFQMCGHTTKSVKNARREKETTRMPHNDGTFCGTRLEGLYRKKV